MSICKKIIPGILIASIAFAEQEERQDGSRWLLRRQRNAFKFGQKGKKTSKRAQRQADRAALEKQNAQLANQAKAARQQQQEAKKAIDAMIGKATKSAGRRLVQADNDAENAKQQQAVLVKAGVEQGQAVVQADEVAKNVQDLQPQSVKVDKADNDANALQVQDEDQEQIILDAGTVQVNQEANDAKDAKDERQDLSVKAAVSQAQTGLKEEAQKDANTFGENGVINQKLDEILEKLQLKEKDQ